MSGRLSAVDVVATLDAPNPPAAVFAWLDDLSRYPEWLDIVPRAVAADAARGDPGPAWLVDLRGRLGPLARSKRLRMVRTTHEPPTTVVFERRELDDRHHSPWVLQATVDPTVDGCQVTMNLHYGGGLWGPVIERLLGDEIEQSRPRLLDCITSTPKQR
ncbi:MAG: SRPBCC family protein [Acidimicrobiales bacterium]